MKLLILDNTGHSTLCSTETDLQAEFDRLCAKGYAMFVNDERMSRGTKLTEVPAEAEILALAPLVGG